MLEVDEKQNKMMLKLGSLVEIGSNEIFRNFVEGRHVAALMRLLEREYLKQMLAGHELLILSIDEADKCPSMIARLIRQITTGAQQKGIKGVRFLLAGVSPFYQQMLNEDAGISRFIYKTIMLAPMTETEATDLMETKLGLVTSDAKASGLNVVVDPDIVQRIVGISGGHPHLLQLLGSYLVEHENENPDGIIDAQDLVTSLRRICYEDRAQVYDSALHKLKIEGQYVAFRKLMNIASTRFPTRIPKSEALQSVDADTLHWMYENNFFSVDEDGTYRLLDEFLRIRLLMDGESLEEERFAQLEIRLLEGGWAIPHEEEDPEDDSY